jgi:hypothetical protein
VPTVVFGAAPIVSLLNLRLERGTTMQPTVNALDITVADVDAKYAELTAAGVTGLQEPFDAPWGHALRHRRRPVRQRHRSVRQPARRSDTLKARRSRP